MKEKLTLREFSMFYMGVITEAQYLSSMPEPARSLALAMIFSDLKVVDVMLAKLAVLMADTLKELPPGALDDKVLNIYDELLPSIESVALDLNVPIPAGDILQAFKSFMKEIIGREPQPKAGVEGELNMH